MPLSPHACRKHGSAPLPARLQKIRISPPLHACIELGEQPGLAGKLRQAERLVPIARVGTHRIAYELAHTVAAGANVQTHLRSYRFHYCAVTNSDR